MRIGGTLCTLALLATGCAGNYTETDALTRVTSASCDWYDRCGRIGEGQEFTSRSVCESNLHAKWVAEWPNGACDGRIRNETLNACLDFMKATECANTPDLVSAVASKCGRNVVCEGATGG